MHLFITLRIQWQRGQAIQFDISEELDYQWKSSKGCRRSEQTFIIKYVSVNLSFSMHISPSLSLCPFSYFLSICIFMALFTSKRSTLENLKRVWSDEGVWSLTERWACSGEAAGRRGVWRCDISLQTTRFLQSTRLLSENKGFCAWQDRPCASMQITDKLAQPCGARDRKYGAQSHAVVKEQKKKLLNFLIYSVISPSFVTPYVFVQ